MSEYFTLPRAFQSIVSRADWLYQHRTDLHLSGYRLQLVMQAQAKMDRVGGNKSILLQWSYNEAIMLDRLFVRTYGEV